MHPAAEFLLCEFRRNLSELLRGKTSKLDQEGINGKPVYDVIDDTDWLKGEFISTVQKRGAAIIEARGSSSA